MRSILYLYRNRGGRDRFREQTFSGIKRYAGMCSLKAVMWLDARPELVAGMLARHHPVVGCVVDCADDNAAMRQDIFGDVPVVYLHAPPTLYGRGISRVEVDHKAVVRTVFRELSLGNPSAYAVVGVAENYSWSQTRIEFFRSLVKEYGYDCMVFRNGGRSGRRASLLARWVASLPQRTAVFAVNDFAASEIVAAAVEAGRKIPRDITLCGIDNAEDICETSEPTITSVQRDLEGEGFIASKMLGSCISGSVSVPPLMPIWRSSTFGSKKSTYRIVAALNMIRGEACNGLEARDVIARSAVSKSLFNMRFREARGHSVHDEIEYVRFEKVFTLLSSTDVAISAIANMCGYRSQRALNKAFNLRTGMSMREWRKLYQKKL